MKNKKLTSVTRVLCLTFFYAIASAVAFGQVVNVPDCNDPDAADLNCTEPVRALVLDAQAAGYEYYVGHAEPSLLFFSKAGASGNNMQWKFKIPATDPKPNQTGTSVANFELYSTFWVGLDLCDPNSNPFGPCIAASDSNNPATAGAAFLELQFYPPGINCSNGSKWCVNLHINTLQNNNTFQKTNCLEPTTAVYVTTNGSPGGTQLSMSNGDTIVVTLHDTPNGLQADVNDVTSGSTGSMVASGANGFVHNSDQTTCNTTAFDFHPMYATAAPGQVVPWASLGPNVSFDFEIGHFELCGNTSCSMKPDSDVDDVGCGVIQGIGGCSGSDLDHDGPPYLADWPDGTAAHPASWILLSPNNQGVGPLSAATAGSTTYNQGYKSLTFKTTEATNGAFYPFYSQSGTGAACVFNFGNDLPATTNDFSKAAQYGTSIQNPCFPAAALPPSISKSFSPGTIGINANTTLTFTILNADQTTALTGLGFNDTLPAGLVVAALNSGNNCGGAISAVPGSHFIGLSGGALAASATCSFSVAVTGVLSGIQMNATDNVFSDETPNGNSATASVAVALPPVIGKSFQTPKKITPGGVSALTFTILNPNSFAALPGVGFTDTLPGLMVVATPNGLTGSCGGGAVTATAGSTTIMLAGATLGAGASCTFSVNVTAPEGIYMNTTTAVFSTYGTGNTASDTLFVASPPNLSKSFGQVSIGTGGTVSLTFTLTNPNHSVTLNALQFTDTLPGGLIVATPGAVTGTCGGGAISAVAGGNTIMLVSAILAPQSTCTFSVNVKADGTALGLLTNTSGAVASTEALPGASASANIFIGDPFQMTYASNLPTGDSVINITNAGTLGASLQFGTSASVTGSICANIYAFSADEQLIACCSCPVTPNGLVSLSLNADLIPHTLTPATPPSVVVAVLGTVPVAGSCNNSAALVGSSALANGIKSYGTTIHAMPITGSFGVTERPFVPATLSAGELSRVGNLCNFILANGSGFGVCRSCTLGGRGAGHE